MPNPLMVIHTIVDGKGGKHGRACWVWCPGCESMHRFQIPGLDGNLPDGPCWQWNGNLESPTFEGSMLVYPVPSLGKGRCHSFVRDGQWQFLSDCEHKLVNQTVPMVPVPDWILH